MYYAKTDFVKHAKNEVPTINVVSGITLHVKLH